MPEMVDEIRINPSYVQHLSSEFGPSLEDEAVAKIRKHVIPTSAYLKKMSQGFSQAGILPPNCRYMEKLNNGHLVVIEEPPAYRTIKVSYSMNHEVDILKQDGKLEEYGIDASYYRDSSHAPFSFTLAIPYTIFILMFDRYSSLMMGQVYLRNARLAGYSDYLLKMPMMNISSEQSICFGDKASIKHNSLNAAIEHTIMVFWSATFNQDYTYNYSAYKDVAGVNTYLGWQALSQIDPMFIYNVDWIKMGNNLHQTIENIKSRYNKSSKSGLQYRELSQLFTQPIDSGLEEKPTATARKTQKLFYDIAQGIYLDSTFYIHVGDPIVWGKKQAFISSFIGFFDSDRIRLIEIEIDGKSHLIRFTNKMKAYIYEGAKKLRFEEQGTLKNGEVIKESDIIIIKDHRGRYVYKKVHFIRKARDGVTEARLGTSFHILENTEGKVFDVKSPVYNGIKISNKERYLLIHSPSSGGAMHGGREVVYDGINVGSGGGLILDFKSTDPLNKGYNYNVDMSNPSYERSRPLFKLEDVKQLPEIFRVGRKLMCIRKNGRLTTGYAWATPEGIAYDNNYSTSYPTINDVTKHLLINDGATFHIESFDLDITFNVGDKVVYSDWKNPVNMLIPRTITAFKSEKDTGDLYFILSDKEGRLAQVKYVSGEPGNGRSPWIHIGTIRKITNKFGTVTAGTKIIAEKGYIPHFPKKDVNIIIGFITDTGGDDPLVLCSNCCTLWYSDMMDGFKRVTMKAKRWATLNHAPIDITKIKAQPGDMINGITDYNQKAGWLVAKHLDYRAARILSLHSYTGGYPDNYSLDGYVRNHTLLDCIPNPRISPAEQDRVDIVPAWPNFHGLFIESKTSPYRFLKDERSLLHVQSSCE